MKRRWKGFSWLFSVEWRWVGEVACCLNSERIGNVDIYFFSSRFSRVLETVKLFFCFMFRKRGCAENFLFLWDQRSFPKQDGANTLFEMESGRGEKQWLAWYGEVLRLESYPRRCHWNGCHCCEGTQDVFTIPGILRGNGYFGLEFEVYRRHRTIACLHLSPYDMCRLNLFLFWGFRQWPEQRPESAKGHPEPLGWRDVRKAPVTSGGMYLT